jgi:peptidylprolyl isomerase
VISRRAVLPTVLALAAVAFAGCGGDDSTTTADIPASAGPPPKPVTTPKASTNLKDTKTKPQVPKQTGKPPTKLVVKDIVVGKGKPAEKGDKLSMQYVGVLYDTGEEFDSSWDSGQPFNFTLGKGMVIKGWDQGLVGIKPGGRRQLTIPAKLAYGPQGQPPSIPPNSTLVFIVDALKVSGK